MLRLVVNCMDYYDTPQIVKVFVIRLDCIVTGLLSCLPSTWMIQGTNVIGSLITVHPSQFLYSCQNARIQEP